jgi:hypothetical protein
MSANMAEMSIPKVIDLRDKKAASAAVVGGKNSQAEVIRDSQAEVIVDSQAEVIRDSQTEVEHEYDYDTSEDDSLLSSASVEEMYRNLTAAGGHIPAGYHPTKSADFQSFETVANPDADITVRKVRPSPGVFFSCTHY